MSTRTSILVRRKGTGKVPAKAVFSVLGGLSIALALVLFSPVGASAQSLHPLNHLASANPGKQENVDRAGVSVVRLLSTYSDSHKQTIQCSGLGVLIASTAITTASEPNNLLLTDGSIINPGTQESNNNQADFISTCVKGRLAHTLDSVKIFASTEYAPATIKLLATYTPPASLPGTVGDITCKVPNACANDLALLRFHTDHPQPHLDTQDGTVNPQESGLALAQSEKDLSAPADSATNPKTPDEYEKLVSGYRTPVLLSQTDKTKQQPGMPIINAQGNLTGLFLRASSTPSSGHDILSFLQTAGGAIFTSLPNPVYQNWNDGITAFYHGNKANAQQAFHAAATANPDFVAASTFEQLAQQAQPPQPAATPTPASGLIIPPVDLSKASFWLLGAGGLVLLLLLIVGGITVSRLRAQARQRAFEADLAEAERQSSVEVARIKSNQLTGPFQQPQQPRWNNQSTLQHIEQASPVIYQSSPVLNNSDFPTVASQSSRMLPCPQCGTLMPADANYCSNCRQVLSPTESGLHLRIIPQGISGMAAPGAPPPPSKRSISDQPTLIPLPPDDSTTLTLDTIDVQGDAGRPTAKDTRVGLVVAARTNPGIKRKSKPNEDSMFAARGTRYVSSARHPIGLFVVADGMGGHANGQDASRRAIQTIVDFLLPRLFSNAELEISYQDLFSESIRHANMAVHHNNMQLGADMGTTVTGALVVGSTAYVSNVGDSRTYLYRAQEGLSKVTQDHSVVASLVDAGIIKPDDIYTHPKRNQIYRSLGEKPVVEVDTFTVPLQPGDKLICCSDGLWDMVRDPRIEALIKNNPDPEDTADALIQAALDGGGDDNVSVIVAGVVPMLSSTNGQAFHLIFKPESVELPQGLQSA